MIIATVASFDRISAQVLIQGRVEAERFEGSGDPQYLSTILAVGVLPGEENEPLSFRTWETDPAGWFRLSGSAGRYTLVFSNPSHFMRPRVLTNQYLRDGDSVDLRVPATFDFACFHDQAWDREPARRYWQPFLARGSGVTSVGFKLATDGVDGAGPEAQDVIVSVHKVVSAHARADGEPNEWPRIGPEMRVVGVDCGGPKSYWYSAGWNSGEVPTDPGGAYAVSIRPARSGGAFQAFWRPRADGSPGVYRVGEGGQRGFEARDVWLAISSDGDGLRIPYNKRVHFKFRELTRFARSWSQTWVAQGRGLCSVVLFAAVSGTQPPLSRQRLRVRVRQGGPSGPLVGIEKIAVGNGNYTGDASWGHFVAAFAPGEVPLQPGQRYALEFESIESTRTISDFVNIKGQPSDGNVGFNPYRKCPPDDYPSGSAYYLGKEEVDYDLDMQIVEYEQAHPRWEEVVLERELLENGAMEEAASPGEGGDATPRARGWVSFQLEATTLCQWVEDTGAGRFLRLSATEAGKPADGGWVQRISGLDATTAYRLTGLVRSTWIADTDRSCRVGFDETGQVEDPLAATIEWTSLPRLHGRFVDYRSAPIRPRRQTVSVWIRASCREVDSRFPFQADFDSFSMREIASGVPLLETDGQADLRPSESTTTRPGFILRILPEADGARDSRLTLVRRRCGYVPVLVHRGAYRFAPENTLEAYAAAMDRGADGFEIDIRRSRDGVLYIFHDDTLDRLTGQPGAVREKTYFELLGYELGGTGARIPTLAAVLTLARDRAALLHLDVKEPGLEEEILRLLEAADLWEHVVEVNDYNAASIREHGKIERLAYKGWFPQEESRKDPATGARFLEQPGTMVFSKWDPIDVVRALGREPRGAEPVPDSLRVLWDASGPR